VHPPHVGDYGFGIMELNANAGKMKPILASPMPTILIAFSASIPIS
jgi:hypothetical protein